MAVALKQRAFANASEVCVYAAAAPNLVVTIISLVFDASSGKYVLFYKET